jgi:hypothetical protein
MEMKLCTKENRLLPLSAFLLKDGKPHPPGSGLPASWCRECINRNRRAKYDRLGPRKRDHYTTIRRRAIKLGFTFELSFEEFSKLIHQRCAYGSGARPNIRIGVDRDDSTKGYTLANSVPCCPRHNEIKGVVFSGSDMRRIVRLFACARECGNTRSGRKKLAR